MLTDLSFLNVGEQWPPSCERERIERYKQNKSLFDSEHARIYNEAFKRIERVINNFQEVVSYPVIINYQKLISLKVADLLVGEEPQIKAGEVDSAEQLAVDNIKKNTDLINKCFEVAIDLSRYGDGLFYIYKDADMKAGMIDVSQPPIWFPITDADNIKKIKMHVLAWIVGEDTDTPTLSVQVHEKGRYEKRQYSLEKSVGTSRMPNVTNKELYSGRRSGFYIQRLIDGGKFEQTTLSDYSVLQVPNVMTSDRIHGMDDYTDIDSIISELLVRLGQIARILDKHAAPSISGPTTALEHDPVTGEWKLKMGNFFPRDGKEDSPVEYITWDGHLEANFKMIEQLINLLHAISEMGGQILGDTNEAGGALSGTALRFKMISPLAKVKRIAMRFKPALEKAIVLCSQLGGEGIVDLSKTSISIKFLDGLPNDPLEEANIMATRSGNKQTRSIQSLIQEFDGLSPDDADTELQQIVEEEQSLNPMMQPITVDPNAANGGNNNASNRNNNSGN